MAYKSFLDCPHKNVQQFTEYCLDCGCNVYMTNEEYYAELRRRAKVNEAAIRKLERKLGIEQRSDDSDW